MVVDPAIAPTEPRSSGDELTSRVGRAARDARADSIRRAPVAIPASRKERDGDALSHRHGGAVAACIDDACPFVSEQHGHRPWPAPIHDREVRMADAGCLQANPHFTRSRLIEI